MTQTLADHLEFKEFMPKFPGSVAYVEELAINQKRETPKDKRNQVKVLNLEHLNFSAFKGGKP